VAAVALAAMAPPARAQSVSALELRFQTHVGEGARGIRRFHRDGCYERESEGGSGGPRVRDSEAGCHEATAVASMFERLDRAAVASALVPAKGDAGHDVIVVRRDGTRWAPADDKVAAALKSAADAHPGENQWYMEAPAAAVGTGPQLVVLQARSSSSRGSRNLQAALSADGRWWCLRPGPARKDAAALLQRIAPRPPGPAAESASSGEITVQIVPPGGSRTTLPAPAAAAALARFGREMRATSPTCAWP